jgi:hypothetical protein
MNWLKRLPQSPRTAAGLEWRLWRRLPVIAAVGTLAPLLAGVLLHLSADDASDAAHLRWLQLADYCIGGAIIFHWTMVLTVAIGCGIVMVMKGPGYAADSYRVPHADQPRKTPETNAEAAQYRDVPDTASDNESPD